MNCFNILLILLSSITFALSGTVYRVKVNSSLNIRKGPGIGYSIVDTLKNGEVIYATSVGNGWAKFYKGYARTTYLTAVSSGTPYVTTTSVNCRTGPSTGYSIISTTSKGDTVTYFGKDPFSTWGVTNRGYMSSAYIKPKGQASSSGGSTGGSSGGAAYRVKVNNSLNIRKGPSTSYSIVDTLSNGQVIYATLVTNGWAKFYKGYVSTSYLTKLSSGSDYVTTTSVNCRTGPSTSYSIISTTSKGDTVTYFGKDPFSTWSVTNRGYMSSAYIKPKGQASSGGSSGGSTSSSSGSSIINNLRKNLNFGTVKNTAMIVAAQKMLNDGYDPKFIAGVLGNIQAEGSPGYFESSNYKTNPSLKPSYLKYVDNNFNYANLYSGKSLTSVGISSARNLANKCKNSGYKGKFGLGMVQWTGDRTIELLNEYKVLNKDKPTLNECAEIEASFIVKELKEKSNFDSIYKEWKSNPTPYNAGYLICTKYEKPSDRFERGKVRGNYAAAIYKKM